MTLKHQLLTLENAELIRLAMATPELAYLFRHALVQEAAYGSMVRADRRRLHLVVGECLERLYSDQRATPELAALLARHFDGAEDSRALPYAVLAAEAASGRYANAEAVSYYSLALTWALRQAEPDQLAGLYVARGRALELNGQFEEAFANYEAMGEAGARLGHPGLRLRALVLRGQLRSTANTLFDIAEAERLAAEGLALAHTLGDKAAEAKIHWNRLNLRRFSGDNPGARASGEASLALARELALTEQVALTLNDLIHVYGALRAWPEHEAAVAEASQLWRDQDNLPMLADSLSTGAMYSAVSGKIEAAQRMAAEAYQISCRISNAWGQAYSLSQLFLLAWNRADFGEALRMGEECLRQAKVAGYIGALALNRAQLARAFADVGKTAQAEAEARLALEWAQQRIPVFTDLAQATLAEFQVAAGDMEAAAATLSGIDSGKVPDVFWVKDPIRYVGIEFALAARAPTALARAQSRLRDLRADGLQLFVPEALEAVARALRQTGQLDAARASLREALADAEAIGQRRTIWLIQRRLAEIEVECGNAAEGARLQSEMALLVNEIAAKLPTQELRESFLKRAAAG
jgi:hypothetical protein